MVHSGGRQRLGRPCRASPLLHERLLTSTSSASGLPLTVQQARSSCRFCQLGQPTAGAFRAERTGWPIVSCVPPVRATCARQYLVLRVAEPGVARSASDTDASMRAPTPFEMPPRHPRAHCNHCTRDPPALWGLAAGYGGAKRFAVVNPRLRRNNRQLVSHVSSCFHQPLRCQDQCPWRRRRHCHAATVGVIPAAAATPTASLSSASH